ncbi:asparagine synthase (glutamine-hydrolysing) [Butyrivibrio proteoclasticus]|uniref:asparagine synthase (glutamine-hydrolyzing) n=1 Tax=Butyrivibrio proteoclasticus TaxID=43305 RepID=A0A1I5PLH1_9FIRM|nr:asparagine synthase (glutamine-hydrolyzing) [Butyrivibrio proteoclasticus]SFP34747.1 asparagine synthase (glutamine-hydrolysing) [Butyrivibrio proteoclasticus]
MCGIAGLIQYKKDAGENIRRMNERMLHRGPDDGGIYISDDGKVALGHRRLAIVDLSKNGAQPMESHSKKSVIVYNGEIYNAAEVKELLLSDAAAKGTDIGAFRGTSDTEVLVEAIEYFGMKRALSLCKGMFAIAVYDLEKGTISFARDRVGEKPLYYGNVAGAFAFASDIGCLRVVDGFDNEINTDVLDIYFEEGYIPSPYSIYKGINKLEPGTILTLNVETLETKTDIYWSMADAAKKGQSNIFTGSRKEAADELERLLKESIKGQMVADVPLGVFLSAGIDSSTVVSLMQSIAPGKVRTFTIGMEDEKYNEAVIAKEIAAHLGTDHTELYINENDAKAVIPKLSFMFGEPFADSSQIPTYLVSKMTRDHVTVSLSGDGGDELFCGYKSYNSVARVWGKAGKMPYALRKPVSSLLMNIYGPDNSSELKDKVKFAKAQYFGAKSPYEVHRMEHESDPIIKKIALKKGEAKYKCLDLPFDFLGEVNHEAMLMDMCMYHPDDILVKVDRTAMAVSLETRVPMLDKDVVEFAWSLPIEYLRSDEQGKLVLRDVLYRYVPRDMMERPKKGFSIPISKWLLEKDIRDWAEALLDKDKIRQQGLLNPDVVEKIWRDFTDRGIYRIQIWYILMFQQWMETEYRNN